MENKKKVAGCLFAGCGGAIVIVLVLAMGIFAFVMNVVKSSDAYKMAMKRAEANPAIVEAIGKPIEAGFFVTGSIHTSGPSGDADVSVPLSGPKGEGDLYIVAKKSAGQWSFTTLEFEGPTGSRVDLLEAEKDAVTK